MNENYKLSSTAKEAIEWIYCIAIAVVIAIAVRYYVGTPTVVKQPSMYPTLKQDQRLILNKLARTLRQDLNRGDIITFEAPSSSSISEKEAESHGMVAKYEYKINGWFEKFIYYVLEIKKISYIKRVIGLPGDHVKIEDGKVYINDEELVEDYLQEGVITDSLGGAFTDLTVPEGTIFVMGDNRGQSTDSRRFGCVPIEKVESKVAMRFWPLNVMGKIK